MEKEGQKSSEQDKGGGDSWEVKNRPEVWGGKRVACLIPAALSRSKIHKSKGLCSGLRSHWHLATLENVLNWDERQVHQLHLDEGQ